MPVEEQLGFVEEGVNGPVSANRNAEMAMCYLAMMVPEFDILAAEPQDFYYEDCRFIYTELQAMHAAGQPLVDQASQVSWFRRADVIARMRLADLPWFDELGQPRPHAEILQLVIDGGFATIGCLDWYKSELRRWRVIRGIRYLSHRLHELIDSDETQFMEVLKWAGQAVQQLEVLAASAGLDSKEK